MLHRCVLFFISKEWPPARERGFPGSHIGLIPAAMPLKNYFRDTTQTTSANDILLSSLCDLLHVFNSELSRMCVATNRVVYKCTEEQFYMRMKTYCMCSVACVCVYVPFLHVPNFHFWLHSVFSSSFSVRFPLTLSHSETGCRVHSLHDHTYNLKNTHVWTVIKTERAKLSCQKEKCTVKYIYIMQAHETSGKKTFFIQLSKVELRSDADVGKKSFKSMYQLKYSQLGPNCKHNPLKRHLHV